MGIKPSKKADIANSGGASQLHKSATRHAGLIVAVFRHQTTPVNPKSSQQDSRRLKRAD